MDAEHLSDIPKHYWVIDETPPAYSREEAQPHHNWSSLLPNERYYQGFITPIPIYLTLMNI